MRIGLFVPYGPFSQESGVIYLLGNYLNAMVPEVVQLRCNGVFAACERDAETGWKRDFGSCFMCMADQQHLRMWSGVRSLDLSTFLSSESIEMSRRWVHGLEASELELAAYGSQPVFERIANSLELRMGGVPYDSNNKRHEQTARSLLLSAVRMREATQRFNQSFLPDLVFVAGGKDVLSAMLVDSCLEQGVEPVVFRWDMHKRSIVITKSSTGEQMSCELMLEGVSNMRPDQKTWPSELVDIVENILTFLDLRQTQLTLPISRTVNG